MILFSTIRKIQIKGFLSFFIVLVLFFLFSCKKTDSLQEHIEHGIVPGKHIVGEELETYELKDRMEYYSVPAVSVAVIDDMQISYAGSWGVKKHGDSTMVNTVTLFQSASVSKPVTAVGVLSLVKEGILELDKDIGSYLTEWKLPRVRFKEKVTIRKLLSHSAGTGVGGFVGYRNDTALPGLNQILDGKKPANSPAVRLVDTPGTGFRYSGGGYLILQQIMKERTGKEFPVFMDKNVFEPVGMNHSFYAPLNESQKEMAAYGHQNNQPIPNYGPIHPESAAGGLWSTPTDLGNLLIELMKAYRGESNKVLSKDLINQMMEQQFWNFGLGFRIMGEGEDIRFSHGGATIGWHSHIIAFPEKGQGVVVMTNGEHGWLLWTEIERAVSRALNWPIIQPKKINLENLPASTLNQYAGAYQLGGSKVVIEKKEETLQLILGNLTLNLIPTARDTFEIKEIEGQAIFDFDDRGAVKNFDLWVGEPDWSPYRRWTIYRIED